MVEITQISKFNLKIILFQQRFIVTVICHDTIENLDSLTLAVSHIEQNSVSESSASYIPFTVYYDSPNVGDQRYL